LKTDLLASLYQELYPNEADIKLVNSFISCPISLEQKYNMLRLNDILNKNKKSEVSLDVLVEGFAQLVKIGQELLKKEELRDEKWRSMPITKDNSVQRKISVRAPWEEIEVKTNKEKDNFFFQFF
jgi:hypothetical protein